MRIERNKDEIIIRLQPTVNVEELQEFANFLRFKEITSKYKTSQPEVDRFASEVNKNWYTANRDRLLK